MKYPLTRKRFIQYLDENPNKYASCESLTGCAIAVAWRDLVILPRESVQVCSDDVEVYAFGTSKRVYPNPKWVQEFIQDFDGLGEYGKRVRLSTIRKAGII